MPRPGLTRWCGRALAAGSALTFLLNATLTPLMARGAPFEQTAATPVFLWRQSLSIAAAALLLIGSIGLYLVQSDRAGAFGAAAFVMALLGSALLMAWEWVNGRAGVSVDLLTSRTSPRSLARRVGVVPFNPGACRRGAENSKSGLTLGVLCAIPRPPDEGCRNQQIKTDPSAQNPSQPRASSTRSRPGTRSAASRSGRAGGGAATRGRAEASGQRAERVLTAPLLRVC